MFSLDDIKNHKSDLRNAPPLKGDHVIGGVTVGDRPFPSFAAVVDGDPQENVRIMVSTASSCSVFDYQTYRRGKLHSQYPYNLAFRPYRPNVDTVTISTLVGSLPMTIYGHAAVPIIIDDVGYQADAFLVDLNPKIQGIFSFDFLKDFDLQLGFTKDGMQRIIQKP
ncbi:hypothetical protein BGZ58_009650 [Dissophora ornata]|nr:hypothetical protein BGZ58_009650 [Dissophora ornata]